MGASEEEVQGLIDFVLWAIDLAGEDQACRTLKDVWAKDSANCLEGGNLAPKGAIKRTPRNRLANWYAHAAMTCFKKAEK